MSNSIRHNDEHELKMFRLDCEGDLFTELTKLRRSGGMNPNDPRLHVLTSDAPDIFNLKATIDAIADKAEELGAEKVDKLVGEALQKDAELRSDYEPTDEDINALSRELGHLIKPFNQGIDGDFD